MGNKKGTFEKGNNGRPKGSKNKVYAKNIEDIRQRVLEQYPDGTCIDDKITEAYIEYVLSIMQNRKASPIVKNKIFNDYLDRIHGKATQKIENIGQLDNKIVIEYLNNNKDNE